MRFLTIYYIVVFFIPFLAICFYQPFLVSWEANVSITSVHMFGLILCLLTLKKDEDIPSIDRKILTALPADILLILWGIFVTLLGTLALCFGLPSSGIVTIWGQLLYATFVIEGLLWIVSGIIFNAIIRALKPQDFS